MAWWGWLIIVLIVVGMFGNAAEEKKKKEAQDEILRRRKEAEYIMSSGDPEAIKMLMLARANPANYNQILAGGMNRGSDTLKMALGVMTGVAVGNLVANAITASAVSSALQNMETDLTALNSSVGDAANDFDLDIFS